MNLYMYVYVYVYVYMWVFVCVLFLCSAPIATRDERRERNDTWLVIEKQCTNRTFIRTRSNDEWCSVADQPPCTSAR